MPTQCPTREQWSEMLSNLSDTELDPAWVSHLDHCQACWSLVGDLTVVPPTAVSARPQLRNSPVFSQDTLPPGYRLGPLRVLSQLGQGGMGCVYLAVDDRCGRQVAVKCLKPARRSAEFFTGLAAEARLLSLLQHPNIIRLLEFNLEHDPPYLVLELATAGSLRQVLKHRTLSQQESVQLVAAVARGVHAAHECGALHLDLKPENVLLMHSRLPGSGEMAAAGDAACHLPWVPRVADFGLCDRLQGAGQFAEARRHPRGTLAWMAPEQISGQSAQLSRATDVYALGVILYELLTGTVPFRSGHNVELSGQICRCPACPPRELCPGISRILNRICLRCLQKETGDRFQTAAELADELDSLNTRSHVVHLLTARSAIFRWLRRPPGILRRPQFSIFMLLQVLLVIVAFVLGGAVAGRFPQLIFSADSPAEVTAAAQKSGDMQFAQLATELADADSLFEFFLLLPRAKDRDSNAVRRIQLLWDTALRPSRKILQDPLSLNLFKNRDPQLLLLARLYDVAGLAEDGQFSAAASTWIFADELAHQLQDQRMLDERLRWRGLFTARLLDRTLTRHNRSSAGLQLLEDAWKLFGPENMGLVRQTPEFATALADFDKYLQARRAQSVQAPEFSISP